MAELTQVPVMFCVFPRIPYTQVEITPCQAVRVPFFVSFSGILIIVCNPWVLFWVTQHLQLCVCIEGGDEKKGREKLKECLSSQSFMYPFLKSWTF